MFNLNTVEGKQKRIEHLGELVKIVGAIPATYLSYSDARAIGEYLCECKRDIEKQLQARHNVLVGG